MLTLLTHSLQKSCNVEFSCVRGSIQIALPKTGRYPLKTTSPKGQLRRRAALV